MADDGGFARTRGTRAWHSGMRDATTSVFTNTVIDYRKNVNTVSVSRRAIDRTIVRVVFAPPQPRPRPIVAFGILLEVRYPP